ncbi:DNA-binding transcriptional response regulator, NtrC family, contains REC, AAA-type ATPase, and a Fis-type DNA-binding domains [Cyclobacterium lianum]|uniref:DNA-binding transcriptional response regulator, NtrC family, contains REC, AAA-type ATPase, and a Fis-type DNA-binding domains n=1 Tax=Cyclobacterium lianum TaxID=388280 RepID=A0A1M7N6T4_9BACT|nr:sigma-54 dependent transcriptional regulator [Cyclobacterium lianum]SHM98774.1 DNA-binding transcriptional response regulator, NtrC family, contains REC, AAA-type ATPase, and a Fis-type DNA-binding domains [Cyclobacterium lianum]
MKVEKAGKILVVDDNEDLLRAAKIFLKRQFGQVDTESNPGMLPILMVNEQYDVILLDMNFTRDVSSGQEGFYWLDRILELDSSAVVVLITAYGDVNTAVKAIKEGATDFVLKPWENEKLLGTLNAALQLRQSKLEISQLRNQQQQLLQDMDQKFKDIIGQSPAMMKVFETIERVAGTDANVLILGENGTGKELVARAIHRNSRRHKEAFVGVDLGSITSSLFESELFGHKKGSFTDAREDRAGRFEQAHKGTLFLDEVGNLPLPLQAKLLATLQNREVTRVGTNRAIPVNIRLISATNMAIHNMVYDNDFRQDLLYRINTIEITLPPLRERQEDIMPLANHFIAIYSKKYNKEIRKAGEALVKRMQKYSWPGNVRELQHSIERAVIMANRSVLQPEDLFMQKQAMPERQEESINLDHYNIEDVEKILIRKALQKHNGHITRAAEELGLTRSSLYRRLERYGL